MHNGITLQNCTIVGNLAATDGGGVYSDVAGVVGVNCIAISNKASQVGSTNDMGGLAMNFSYSCSPDLIAGVNSNITADPMFVNSGSGYGTNWIAGDYRLKLGSPCIDTGTNLPWMASAVDLLGNPRIQGVNPNMGAYETPVKGVSIGTLLRVY
jgi:hypothetical protein